MRKESIGRLLLTMVTAFVMVAGTFGAAVQTWSDLGQTGDQVDQPSEMAISEFGLRMDEAGEAPASVISPTGGASINDGSASYTDITSESEIPSAIQLDLEDADSGTEEMSIGDSTFLSTPLDHGTRAATVDAGGPYGEMPPDGTPYYEGDTVNFDGDIVGGNKADYKFRWDVDHDDTFDGPGVAPDYWGAKGETAYTQDFKDNCVGEAKLEAWDGSMATVTGGGDIWNENMGVYVYLGGYLYCTIGMKFRANRDITIDELGVYRYASNYARTYYNIRLWDASTQTILRQISYPSLPYYAWSWFNVAPITIPAGDYMISVGIYYYYQIGLQDPGMTSDGVIEPLNWARASGQYSYPSQDLSTPYQPKLDFKYSYTYEVPNLIEGVADVFVDNRAPVAINPQVIGEPGQEGSEVEFTGAFLDAGLDDDWLYRWTFGDGQDSGWLPVNKWSGGARILLATTWRAQNPSIVGALDNELGNFDKVIDIWNWEPSQQGVPELDYLLTYDVVVVAENYYGYENRDPMGDVLADYSDAGGNVVTAWVTNYVGGGVLGRWQDDDYNCIPQSNLWFSQQSLGTVYDPTHPMMQGVTRLTTQYGHYATTVMPDATRLADTNNGRPFVAYKDNPMASGGRIVDTTMFPAPVYCTGDYMTLFANMIKWASQQPDPQQIPMPIALDLVSHIYKDDHPKTLTPVDTFDVQLEIKDDDHERVVGGAGADWNAPNMAEAPQAVATHSGGGSGVWGPQRLNNGDKIGTYNDCWTAYGGGTNWNQLVWPSPVTIGGTKSYYTRYRTLNGYCMHSCDIEYWTGSGWQFVLHYDDLDHGNHRIDAIIPLPAPITTTRLRMSNMLTYTTNGNIMIQEWEVFPPLPGGDSYTMLGIDEAFTTCTIENVYPGAINPLGVVLDVAENTPILYEGFEITDNALGQATENFFYRWDFDDGTAITPWTPAIVKSPTSLDVLLIEWINMYGSSDAAGLEEAIQWSPLVSRYEKWNLYDEAEAPPLAYMEEFDVIIYANNWAYTAWWNEITLLGDRLADFQDNTGGGVITMMTTYGGSYYRLDGRYIDEDYGPFEMGAYAFGSPTLGTVHQPSHPIMSGVVPGDVKSDLVYSGNYALTADAELLADWVGGNTAIGIKEKPGSGKSVHIGIAYYGGNSDGDDLLIHNAMLWTGTKFSPVTDTQPHNFMDNGIYYVDLQIIDDDMLWEFTPSGPVFTGTPGTEMSWIAHNIYPTSVDNSDPVISPRIRAYGELDLSLRMSGNKRNTATMRLETFKDGVSQGTQEVTVERDPGAPDIGVLSAIIEMTGDYSYNLEIEYDPNDLAGANPCWIFEGHFPDGKIKELKHTFNSNDPTDRVWNLGNVKQLLLGHDIIFEAEASDDGSDDLAFVWSWGDQTPQGVHIYANADPSVLDGVTDVANQIFDQDPDRDPWFDRTPNTKRSPDGTAITIRDSISHVFDESQPAYIYVTLTVIDDDVYDGYPSTFLNGGGYDMEFAELDFR